MNPAAMIFIIFLALGLYFFFAFVHYRIGQKFGIGSFGEYCVPVYNMVLICRCAGISPWSLLGLLIPYINFGFCVYIFGSLARRLGQNFWVFGFLITILGFPLLILAFDSSKPVYGAQPDSNNWKPQRERVKEETIYKPLPANAQYVQLPTPASSSAASIYCSSGEYRGNSIPITPEGITIGRDPSRCQIVLLSNDASRAHTSVSQDRNDPRSVVVTDLQSTNGTFTQIPGSSPQSFKWERIAGSTTLRQGGRFRIGKDVAEFEVR